MEAVFDAARSSGSMVVIDCNWRPMFWPNPDSAKPVVEEFLAKGDVLKITDEEAEWLYGISSKDALENPGMVRLQNPLRSKRASAAAAENSSPVAVL